jgi:hypothetical protein
MTYFSHSTRSAVYDQAGSPLLPECNLTCHFRGQNQVGDCVQKNALQKHTFNFETCNVRCSKVFAESACEVFLSSNISEEIQASISIEYKAS